MRDGEIVSDERLRPWREWHPTMSRFRDLLERRVDGPHRAQGAHAAHHARPDRRRRRDGRRGRPDREREGRTSSRSSPSSARTSIIAQAGGTFGSQNPTFPADAVHRVEAIPTVTSAAATTEPVERDRVADPERSAAATSTQPFPVPVRAADLDLPSVLAGAVDRRPLVEHGRHVAAHADRRCSAPISPSSTRYLRGENRTIQLNGINYAVVGVLGSVALDPDLDNAVFITQWAAKHDFATDGKPNQLYVRSKTGDTQQTADAIPTAINLGGTRADVDQCAERRVAGGVAGRTRPCNRPRCSRACSR